MKAFNRFKDQEADIQPVKKLQKLENRNMSESGNQISENLNKQRKNSLANVRSVVSPTQKHQIPGGQSLPIFYMPQSSIVDQTKNNLQIPGSSGPQYPAIKLNVSQYEVADILEESFDERRRESVIERKMSKIKKILSSPPKGGQGYLQAADSADALLKIDIHDDHNTSSFDYNLVNAS